ncbi:MAG: histidine phosphatase family protein [Culturomica sp.]|jgi:broad specificity phosphatase PhoE|nr:histidine phosphatase family protein [Culturomica sp.]
MKLILVRHGETVANRRHILQGQTHGKLTAEGVSQADKVAGFLASFDVDICFTSDLRRAVDTAAIVALKHPRMRIVKDIRLRERYLGEIQGRKIPADWDGTGHYESAEPVPELYERVKSFVSYILTSHPDQVILIVSHGITLKILLSVCLGYDALQFPEIEDLKNGSVSILEQNPESLLFKLVDSNRTF